VHGADGIARVVLAREQHLGFGLAYFAFEPLDERAQFSHAVCVFARFREFKEHARVFDGGLESLLSVDDALKAAALLQQLLRRVLILPEILRARLPLDAL
jgi:hypothetical protein